MPRFSAASLRDLGSNEVQAGTVLDMMDDARLRAYAGHAAGALAFNGYDQPILRPCSAQRKLA
jgi:hypothetical protein